MGPKKRKLSKAEKEETSPTINGLPTLGTKLVEVVVGENAARFMVHKDLICNFSEYFRRAFAPPFKESEDGSITIGASEETFKVFQHWLYAQLSRPVHVNDPITAVEPDVWHMDTVEDDDDIDSGEEDYESATTLDDIDFDDEDVVNEYHSQDDESDAGFRHAAQDGQWSDEDLSKFAIYDDMFFNLLDLFAFADLYETRQLRNDVVSALFTYDEAHDTTPALISVPRTYELLPESSTFLQYCFKRLALAWNPDADHPEYEGLVYDQLPRSFLFEMMKLNTRRLTVDRFGCAEVDRALRTEMTVRCNFHEHTNDKERLRCIAYSQEDSHILRLLVKACGGSWD